MLRSTIIAISVSLPFVFGCGPSQEDLMMRQARRSRGPENPPADATPSATQGPLEPQTPPDMPLQKPNDPSPQVADSDRTAEPTLELDDFDASELGTKPAEGDGKEKKPSIPALIEKPLPLPISKREKPAQANEREKAEKTVANLNAIADAVTRFNKKTGRLPIENVRDSSGSRITLSWRVSLLPFMGYSELYERFNFDEPWDGPNNIKLLNYIPDEFLSPERGDYRTNYLGGSSNGYAFGGAIDEGTDIDPWEDTILLMEVDDAHAVPWTKPEDCKFGGSFLRQAVGNLRAMGTFVVWADGKVGVVPNGVPVMEMHAALTLVGGENQPASKVNRAIRFDNDLENFEDNVQSTSTAAKASTPASVLLEPEPADEPRLAVPTALELTTANARLKSLYAQKLESAKDDTSKLTLAKEMLDQATQLDADPAGRFALNSASMNLAIAGGDIDTLLRAVDDRVGKFEVNSIRENMSALLNFGNANTNRRLADASTNTFLKRAIPVLYASCINDDYPKAVELLKLAARFRNESRTDPIPKQLNVIRTKLGNAQRQYETAKESLAEYRENENNADSAAAFGRFLCFIKGDWSQGLPLLAKGTSSDLTTIAEMDMKGATSDSEKIQFGDAWWQLSDRAQVALYRHGARERAAFWYRAALDSLPGSLDQLHVKGRLAEVTGADGTPIGSIMSLAEMSGVDLSQSLRGLARGTQAKPVQQLD
jgi:hypothetical protein